MTHSDNMAGMVFTNNIAEKLRGHIVTYFRKHGITTFNTLKEFMEKHAQDEFPDIQDVVSCPEYEAGIHLALKWLQDDGTITKIVREPEYRLADCESRL